MNEEAKGVEVVEEKEEVCQHCNGTKECNECVGSGEGAECPTCGCDTYTCPDCEGSGICQHCITQ